MISVDMATGFIFDISPDNNYDVSHYNKSTMFRLDHLPLTILQYRQAEGFDLHGGNVDENGIWQQDISYDCRLESNYPAHTSTTVRRALSFCLT